MFVLLNYLAFISLNICVVGMLEVVLETIWRSFGRRWEDVGKSLGRHWKVFGNTLGSGLKAVLKSLKIEIHLFSKNVEIDRINFSEICSKEKLFILECILSAPNGLLIVETNHSGDNQVMLTKYVVVFPRKTTHFGMHPKCTEWSAK